MKTPTSSSPSTKELTRLERELTTQVNDLKKAFDDIIWMAIRYAHGRSTYAPHVVRDSIKLRAKHGCLKIKKDITLEYPTDYPPFNSGALEEVPKSGIYCDGDDLRDLMEKYK